MDDSQHQDGAGAALIAFVIVVLLVIAVAAYFWLTSITARRAAIERALQMEQAQVAAQAEQARAAEFAARAGEGAASRPQLYSELLADVETAIRGVLAEQLDAWNAGDIDAFMEHYWKSDDLTFSSAGNLTRGWQATLESYKLRYPTRDEMGQTTFDNLEISLIGPDGALVLGDWRLQRESGDIGGKFSLVFRRIDGAWVIVHDHTSRAEQP